MSDDNVIEMHIPGRLDVVLKPEPEGVRLEAYTNDAFVEIKFTRDDVREVFAMAHKSAPAAETQDELVKLADSLLGEDGVESVFDRRVVLTTEYKHGHVAAINDAIEALGIEDGERIEVKVRRWR
jgi:hypothetical protein